MIVYPAIDLKDGICVRLMHGRFDAVTRYDDQPAARLAAFATAGATWAHIVDLESQIAVANADVGSMGYLTNAKVRGKLKTTSKVTGQNGFIWEGASLNGYNAAVSNQVPSNLTKGTASGVCSAIMRR